MTRRLMIDIALAASIGLLIFGWFSLETEPYDFQRAGLEHIEMKGTEDE